MKIGVLCSGGDAPGMNPCLRAIVRAAGKYDDYKIVGIKRGYQGLFEGAFYNDGRAIDVRDVSGLSNKGGAFLNSSRCPKMYTEDGVKEAAEILKVNRFSALICIGGNGTLAGARDLAKFWDGQIIGIPGTIDNDLLGTDITIGFPTAVQTAVEAIDKLRDTAGSHDMMFVVEVMGRHCGDLAVYTALAGGSEVVAVPETETNFEEIANRLKEFKMLGKRSIIMVVAEGDESLGGTGLVTGVGGMISELKKHGCPYEMRSVVLGHIQRGGTPCPTDRILATELGYYAIEAIRKGETNKMVGEISGSFVLTELDEVVKDRKGSQKDQIVMKLERLLNRMSI